MSEPIRILSTKKLKSGDRKSLSDAGFFVTETDFIIINNKPFALSDIKNNLIFTSQNAVKAVCDHPDVQEIRRNPVFCVGEKTAQLLDEMGFTVLGSADYGSDLADLIVSDYPSEKFTFFCGNIRRDELPEKLKIANVDFNEIEVYETVLSPMKINSDIDGILFFSPSAVDSFISQNEVIDQICFCIGKTTADHLLDVTNLDPAKIVVSKKPTISGTIDTCVYYYNNLPDFKNQRVQT